MLDGIVTRTWFPIFTCFLIADIISVAYLSVYIYCTKNLKCTLKVVGSGVAFYLLITLYAILGDLGLLGQSHHGVENTMGYLGVTIGLSMYSSPLERIMMVLKYRSAAFIPIPMVVAGITNNIMWIIYTPMVGNWFMLVGNSMCLVVGIVNITLYLVFNPKTHPLPDDFSFSNGAAANEPPPTDELAISFIVTPRETPSDVHKKSLGSPVYASLRSPLEPIEVQLQPASTSEATEAQ